MADKPKKQKKPKPTGTPQWAKLLTEVLKFTVATSKSGPPRRRWR